MISKPEQTEQYKKAVLIALEKSLGVVTEACKQAGIGRTTFYEWLKEDKDFAVLVDDVQEIALDYAESQLFKNIGAGKEASLIFYLKTKGRKRGYVEKIQGTFTAQQEIINLDALTDEQREELVQLAKARRKQISKLGRQSSGDGSVNL